jgi:phosphatidylglycerophosphate synthase
VYIGFMKKRTIPEQTKLGERLQTGADMLCHARRWGATAIAAFNIAADNPRTWGATAVTAANYATDKADGMLARQASKVLDRPPTPAGKKLDQSVDKAAHNMVAASHILTAWQRRQRVFAGVMALSLGVQVWRDRIVNAKREEADQVAADTDVPIHTGSIPSSKVKMGVIAAADIGTQSPLADSRYGRLALGAAHLAGTVLSVTTGMHLVSELNGGISEALATPYPDIGPATVLPAPSPAQA